MREPVPLLRDSLLRLWRALLSEKAAAGSALPSEKIERLASLFALIAQRAESTSEMVAVAEPTESERLLFQLWPKGLPHLSDLRNLAQAQGKPIEWHGHLIFRKQRPASACGGSVRRAFSSPKARIAAADIS
jgi:hypothetical protein